MKPWSTSFVAVGYAILSASAVLAAPAQPPVPVTVGKAVKRDFPSVLEELGTVQAYNTVAIRPQVNGQLVKLAAKEGQDVKTGDLLFEIDPRPFQAALDQAVAKKAQDQAQLANAKLDLQRYATLVEKNYIARQQMDTTQSLVSQLEAQVKGDEAAAENAKVTLEFAFIRSPIDGRVGIRNVDIGNIVHTTDVNPMVTITQIQPIFLMFTLPEESLQNVLAAASRQKLAVVALSRDGTKHLDEGELDLVDNQIDQTTGMVKLRATLPNRSRNLWPGLFVNARLSVEKLAGVVVMPVTGIQRGPDGRYAYVVNQDNTVEQRPIEIGPVNEGMVVVTKGVNDGETVVLTGAYRLQPGAKVDIRPNTAAAQ